MRRFFALLVIALTASSLAACNGCDPCDPFDPCGSRRLPPLGAARPMPTVVSRPTPFVTAQIPAPMPVATVVQVPQAPPPTPAPPAPDALPPPIAPPAVPSVPSSVACDDGVWPDYPSVTDPQARRSLDAVIESATRWQSSKDCDAAGQAGWAQVLSAATLCKENGLGHSATLPASPHGGKTCEVLMASVQRAREASSDPTKWAQCLLALNHAEGESPSR